MAADPMEKRWSQLPAEGASPEAKAARLVQNLPQPARLSAEALARIEAGIEARLAPRPGHMPRWVKAVVAGVVLAGAPALMVAVMRWTRPEAGVPPPAVAPAPVAAPPPAAAPPAPAPLEIALPAPGLAPAPSAVRSARPPAPAPAEPESALAAESRLLSEALQRLRQQRDPQGALGTLDAYDGRFPAGQLRSEARVARIEALLALGRRGEALSVLEQLSSAELDALPRATELRVLQGELLGEAGRCPEALTMFDRSTAQAGRSPLQERILLGRAACRARLGDAEGSRSELRRYLDLFPDGRLAGEARRLLAE